MIKLKKSEILRRIIRQDDVEDLFVPTWTLVKNAIREGKAEEAMSLLDYSYSETKAMHDSMVSFVDDILTHLARFDEEEIYKVMRKRYEPMIHRWLSDTPNVKESLERAIEFQRGHGGNSAIIEESDKYVVRCDPCGSGGQLRRAKNVETTKKAYPWTWGKRGVPYYCTHCCVMWEILPIEMRGYPIRVNMIGENPSDPCIHYYYKKPELIPEEYFARIGQSKKVSK